MLSTDTLFRGACGILHQKTPCGSKESLFHTPKEGKKSITLFKVLEKKELALIECRLLTGRTHQARIHSLKISRGYCRRFSVCSCAGNTKVSKTLVLLKKIRELDRIALHAISLSFIHPETKKEMTFRTPFPDLLKDLMNK